MDHQNPEHKEATAAAGWWGPLDGPEPSASSGHPPARDVPADSLSGCKQIPGGLAGLVSATIAGTAPVSQSSARQTAEQRTADQSRTRRPEDSAHDSLLERKSAAGRAAEDAVEYEELRKKLERVRRGLVGTHADMDALVHTAAAGNPEAATLMQDICSAAAKKQALEGEAREHVQAIEQLEEASRNADDRLAELEARVLNMEHEEVRARSAGAETSEDAAARESVWREPLAHLEGELRRKSARALDLHRRVHWLEEQLGRQLDENEQRAQKTHEALRTILAVLPDFRQAAAFSDPAATQQHDMSLYSPIEALTLASSRA
eukprot:TRINITY_DN13528_c0_g1_i4.p1 TRINITY_DN13528_c0_g1~~TRINITY_DN13528_c0_g1_i4.p1  ORF type:complete len:320 (+),score=64.16 TRINITY_DN13528_c0_g1_i4:192-1151(+)